MQFDGLDVLLVFLSRALLMFHIFLGIFPLNKILQNEFLLNPAQSFFKKIKTYNSVISLAGMIWVKRRENVQESL